MDICLIVLHKTSEAVLIRVDIGNKSKEFTVNDQDCLNYRMNKRDIAEGKAMDIASSYYPNESNVFNLIWSEPLWA